MHTVSTLQKLMKIFSETVNVKFKIILKEIAKYIRALYSFTTNILDL